LVSGVVYGMDVLDNEYVEREEDDGSDGGCGCE
jgi:hypothetical protein